VCTSSLPWAHSRVVSFLVYSSFFPWELTSFLLKNLSSTSNQTLQAFFLHASESNINLGTFIIHISFHGAKKKPSCGIISLSWSRLSWFKCFFVIFFFQFCVVHLFFYLSWCVCIDWFVVPCLIFGSNSLVHLEPPFVCFRCSLRFYCLHFHLLE